MQSKIGNPQVHNNGDQSFETRIHYARVPRSKAGQPNVDDLLDSDSVWYDTFQPPVSLTCVHPSPVYALEMSGAFLTG